MVLEYTEAVTYSDRPVTGALVGRLKGFFDADGIVELTGVIAFRNLFSKYGNKNRNIDRIRSCQSGHL